MIRGLNSRFANFWVFIGDNTEIVCFTCMSYGLFLFAIKNEKICMQIRTFLLDLRLSGIMLSNRLPVASYK